MIEPPHPEAQAGARYAERATAFGRRRDRLARRRRLLLAAAIVAVAAGFGVLRVAAGLGRPAPGLGGGLLILAGAAFGLLWLRLDRPLTRFARLTVINEDARRRLVLDWEEMPWRHTIAAGTDHPYATDLDLFGRESIFRRLEGETTPLGQQTLADWLMEPAGGETIRGRQRAVRELASLLDLRQEIAVQAAQIGADGPSAEPFLLWAEARPRHRDRVLARAALVSPIAGWSLAALQVAGVIAFPLWAPFLLANLAICLLAGGRAFGTPQALWQQQGTLRPYAAILRLLAGAPVQAPRLAELRRRLSVGGGTAERELRRLRRWSRLSFPLSSEFYWPVQALFLLDITVTGAADRWRARNGPHVRGWLDAVGEVEALAALAVLAHDHPGWSFPEVDEQAPVVQARGLGHPLIPADVRVVNDVEVGPAGTFLFVTGSNMSGKSTLLRALGVNLVLAGAGAPVCAAALRMPPLRLWTAMRVQDSLARGESYFLAEVLRLKALVDAADAVAPGDEHRFLYLIDEIFQGTNSLERQIGGRRLIRALLARNALGAVSTHDLDLVRTAELERAARCIHFTETVVEGSGPPRMTFDYRVRPGLATSTNALRVMAMVGLDLPDEPAP